jgi:hypothetical protein
MSLASLLIMDKADVNARDEHGEIALHHGSEIDIEFVKILSGLKRI